MVRLWDEGTTHAKVKRHICVSPERRLFLRINSDPLWPPHHEIDATQCPGIVEHTSYVELRALYRHGQAALRRDWARPGNPLGIISGSVAYVIGLAAMRADTLTDEQKDVVWRSFSKLF